MMEFHISRTARDRYHFDEDIFSLSGNVILANFQAVRQFAYQMNLQTDLVNIPGRLIKAGDINAMGMIDEILHLVVELYRKQIDPQVIQHELRYLVRVMGLKELDKVLSRFNDEFPSVSVYRGTLDAKTYLNGVNGGRSNREIILEEIMLLWLANVNPAFSPYQELFDDSGLRKETPYLILIDNCFKFFDKQPFFGPDLQNLIAMLRAPALAAPHSLPGQLEYIRTHWVALLGDYLQRILGSLDFLSEQDKLFIPGGPGPSQVYLYDQMDNESEKFSRDSDWMPNCVLIAKNVYVWLNQLSTRYKRSIDRLDEIPGEELERLAQLGINGLWLIGLWERSIASRRIKQLCGNPKAEASAYSLADYSIANDLGGTQAFQGLQDKATHYGIRLASDMVPNHMGIDSSWVFEHPDWFLSLDRSPFPSYSFNGPDLSSDGRVGLYLEDHYYTRNDASVVFKRLDRSNGQVQYLYHGNDGTNMPWNDTAQLNYMNPQVREEVIQTILSVARRFQIIRFDAAMTLAKKHYQRLWFPEPGNGGAIPTRAEYGMSKSEFDRLMPQEFWRDVVERVSREAPDTLLLAEAFWMMEGYFVRSLGMHRVYNSAFMNMLRDEENASYRLVIKNTLEYDPQILKRYVNFMSNPDEKTAVEQFGKGDKYFGICILMATMPGLPMFGHGQIEGFTEKYGMEYRRAFMDEEIDEAFVDRHRRIITPLLYRRRLFSEVDHFLLFDFFNDNSQVNEDVFVYSNQVDGDHCLILFNNRFNPANGWVKHSASYMRQDGAKKGLTSSNLGDALGLSHRANKFVIFRDQITNLEFIRKCQNIHAQGIHFDLDAYQYHVFMDFREVTSSKKQDYARIEEYLGGRGVTSIDFTLDEFSLIPLLQPFRSISNPEIINKFLDSRGEKCSEFLTAGQWKTFRLNYQAFLQATVQRLGDDSIHQKMVDDAIKRIDLLLCLPNLAVTHKIPSSSRYRQAQSFLSSLPFNEKSEWLGLMNYIILAPLSELINTLTTSNNISHILDNWHLTQEMRSSFLLQGIDIYTAHRTLLLVYGLLIINESRSTNSSLPLAELFKTIFDEPHLSEYLRLNTYNNVLWYDQEAFNRFTLWLAITSTLKVISQDSTESDLIERMIAVYGAVQSLKHIEKKSECQVAKLIDLISESEISFP